jgi:hypothetical protein
MKLVGTMADEAGTPLAGPTALIGSLQGPAPRAGKSTKIGKVGEAP